MRTESAGLRLEASARPILRTHPSERVGSERRARLGMDDRDERPFELGELGREGRPRLVARTQELGHLRPVRVQARGARGVSCNVHASERFERFGPEQVRDRRVVVEQALDEAREIAVAVESRAARERKGAVRA